ncbi:hypothetical protein PGT21_026664 [Puccinia graminis f. sp. tritici]|uniref:Uncharacterized protein n=1 Tax=Puccinia graminis f. sp. tritici TaxID=56615 RepID=A0A5B0QBU1_PUCGR|nr:hypothetical protein PGT21_026664 [Puccinia graminis f. sp. tritici]
MEPEENNQASILEQLGLGGDNDDDDVATTRRTSTWDWKKKNISRATMLLNRDKQGETIREIIRITEQAKSSTIPPHSCWPSQASVRSLRLAEAQSKADLAKSEAKKIIQLARLSSKTLNIQPSLLGLEPESNQNQPIGFPSNLHTQNQAIIRLLAHQPPKTPANQNLSLGRHLYTPPLSQIVIDIIS